MYLYFYSLITWQEIFEGLYGSIQFQMSPNHCILFITVFYVIIRSKLLWIFNSIQNEAGKEVF